MSIEQLNEQTARRDQLVDEILANAARIAELIVHDLPAYFEREVRAQFVEAVDFAEALDDDALIALKAAIIDRTRTLGEALREALGARELWIHDALPAADGKSLEPNAGVWEVLGRIPAACAQLLAEHSFPTRVSGAAPADADATNADADDADADAADADAQGSPDPVRAYGLTYRPPVYFIKGEYLPGLIEKYWARLSGLRAVEEVLEEQRLVHRRAQLEQRWDSVQLAGDEGA